MFVTSGIGERVIVRETISPTYSRTKYGKRYKNFDSENFTRQLLLLSSMEIQVSCKMLRWQL